MISCGGKSSVNRYYIFLIVPSVLLISSLTIGSSGYKDADGIHFSNLIDCYLSACWFFVLLFCFGASLFHYCAKTDITDQVATRSSSIKYSPYALVSSLFWHCSYLCALSCIVFFSSYSLNVAHLAYLAIYTLEGIALFLSYYDYSKDNQFIRLKWFSNTELTCWFGIIFCVFVTWIDRFHLDLAGTKTLFNAVFALVIIQYTDQLYKQRINRKNEYYGVNVIS